MEKISKPITSKTGPTDIAALTAVGTSITIKDEMDESIRRAVAYIAGRASSGRSSSAVFDYTRSRYFSFSGRVTESAVSAFDYSEHCHIGGSGHSGSFSLYHYGGQQHIRLQVDGRKFRGYAYGSGGHFSGTVNGRSVAIFDFEHSTWHTYAI